jgi:hypothetical protein
VAFRRWPRSGEQIELVGERHGDGDRLGGHHVGGAERLVVIGDGVADGARLALRQRSSGPSGPAVRGNSPTMPVTRSPWRDWRRASHFDVGANQRGDLAGERDQSFDALELSAELLVENGLEHRQPSSSGMRDRGS